MGVSGRVGETLIGHSAGRGCGAVSIRAWLLLQATDRSHTSTPGQALLAAAANADEQGVAAWARDDAADARHVLHRVLKQDQIHHCRRQHCELASGIRLCAHTASVLYMRSIMNTVWLTARLGPQVPLSHDSLTGIGLVVL